MRHNLIAGLLTTGLIFLGGPSMAQAVQPPDMTETFQRGLQSYNNNHPDEALVLFRQVVDANPKHIDAWYNLGALAFNMQRYPEALDAFNHILQVDPNDQTIRYETGRVYAALGRIPEAQAAFEMVGPTSPRYAKAQEFLTKLQQQTANPVTLKPQQPVNPIVVQQPQPNAIQESATQVFLAASKATPITTKTKVETFVSGLYGPTGLAVDAKGIVYVANFSKNTIYTVSPSGEKKLFAVGKGINGPVGLVLDRTTGNLYIANHLDSTVAQISPDGKIKVIATGLKKPYNMFLDEANRTLYITQQETNAIAKVRLN